MNPFGRDEFRLHGVTENFLFLVLKRVERPRNKCDIVTPTTGDLTMSCRRGIPSPKSVSILDWYPGPRHGDQPLPYSCRFSVVGHGCKRNTESQFRD